MEKVYSKSKKGFVWTVISNGLQGGLGFLTLLVLTYVLGVEKMGIISILGVIYGLSETVVQFGLSRSIISREKTTDKELTSIFWTNLGIGFVVFLAVNLLADIIAQLYDQPDMGGYIKVLSIIFLVEPLDLVFRAVLERELEFARLQKVKMFRFVFQAILIITLVLLGFGVISYVYGIIAATALSAITFLIIFLRNNLWVPSLHFKLSDIKEHYSFGAYVTGKSFLNYMGRHFDELIVGAVLGVEPLGIYYFAKKVVERPMQLFVRSFSKVSFPMFSKLKSKLEKMTKAYFNLMHAVSSVGFLIFGSMIVFAPLLIPLIFGEEWVESIFLIQVFSLTAFLDVISAGFSSPILYVFRDPKYNFKVDLFMTPFRLLLIFLASLISIEAVVITFFLVVIFKVLLLQNRVNHYLKIDFGRFFKNLQNPLQNVFLSLLISGLFFLLFDRIYPELRYIVLPLIFLITYGLFLWFRERDQIYYIKDEVLKETKNGKKKSK